MCTLGNDESCYVQHKGSFKQFGGNDYNAVWYITISETSASSFYDVRFGYFS